MNTLGEGVTIEDVQEMIKEGNNKKINNFHFFFAFFDNFISDRSPLSVVSYTPLQTYTYLY